MDIQNVYNFKSTSNSYLVQETDDLGNPIIENPTDPEALQRYQMKELNAQAGTILPSIGIIIEF